jgi:hypothetical protein
LTEHRQADPNGTPGAPGRVGINQNYGGWFIEMDSYYDEDPKFKTENYELPIMIKAPEYAPDPTDSDNPFYDFIKNDMNELCDSLASSQFPENGYRDLIDINTFIDYLISNEIVCNQELQFPKSAFAFKLDQSRKINMGPLWDFDWAFYYSGKGHEYFRGYTGHILLDDFFMRLFDDPVFVVKYKERWNEKYNEIMAMNGFIDSLGEKIRLAVLEDATRWVIPGGYRDDYDPDHTQNTKDMSNWWENRVTWLSTEIYKAEMAPKSMDFGVITTDDDYPGVTTQTFTLVTYNRPTNLMAVLVGGGASAFELNTSDFQAQATGNGGFLARLTVKLKENLTVGTYSDILAVRCMNRGKEQLLYVPLHFAITDQDITGVAEWQVSNPLRAWTQNGLLHVTGFNPGDTLSLYSAAGTLLYHNVTASDIVNIPLADKGVYIVRVGNHSLKVVNGL